MIAMRDVVLRAVSGIGRQRLTPNDVRDDAVLSELGIDSIAVITVLIELEDMLDGDLTVLGAQIEPPRTVADLIDIAGRLSASRCVNDKCNDVSPALIRQG